MKRPLCSGAPTPAVGAVSTSRPRNTATWTDQDSACHKSYRRGAPRLVLDGAQLGVAFIPLERDRHTIQKRPVRMLRMELVARHANERIDLAIASQFEVIVGERRRSFGEGDSDVHQRTLAVDPAAKINIGATSSAAMLFAGAPLV